MEIDERSVYDSCSYNQNMQDLTVRVQYVNIWLKNILQ